MDHKEKLREERIKFFEKLVEKKTLIYTPTGSITGLLIGESQLRLLSPAEATRVVKHQYDADGWDLDYEVSRPYAINNVKGLQYLSSINTLYISAARVLWGRKKRIVSMNVEAIWEPEDYFMPRHPSNSYEISLENIR